MPVKIALQLSFAVVLVAVIGFSQTPLARLSWTLRLLPDERVLLMACFASLCVAAREQDSAVRVGSVDTLKTRQKGGPGQEPNGPT